MVPKMKPAISVSHFYKFNRRSLWEKSNIGLLQETKYNLFQSCYLKKSTTSNPLSLMAFKNEIHTQEQ